MKGCGKKGSDEGSEAPKNIHETCQTGSRDGQRGRGAGAIVVEEWDSFTNGGVQAVEERPVNVRGQWRWGGPLVAGESSGVVVAVKRENDAARAVVLNGLFGKRVRCNTGEGNGGLRGVGGKRAVRRDGSNESDNGCVVSHNMEGRVGRV